MDLTRLISGQVPSVGGRHKRKIRDLVVDRVSVSIPAQLMRFPGCIDDELSDIEHGVADNHICVCLRSSLPGKRVICFLV